MRMFSPEEVVSYRDYDGLVAALRSVLVESQPVRTARADAAAARAHAEHTYRHRFERIIEVLGRG